MSAMVREEWRDDPEPTPCRWCDGTGEVITHTGTWPRDLADPDEADACPECNGTGVTP